MRAALLLLFVVPAVCSRIIFTGDCAGGGHVLPGSPLEINVNMAYFKSAYSAFSAGVIDRAMCACPSMSEDAIRELFLPTLPSFLNWIATPYANRSRIPDECADAFTRKFFSDSSRSTSDRVYQSAGFLDLFFPIQGYFSGTQASEVESAWLSVARQFPLLAYMPWNLAFRVVSLLGMPFTVMSTFLQAPLHDHGMVNVVPPATCTAATVAAGEGCLFGAEDPHSHTRLNFAFDTCPDSTLTYVSVSCSGGFCDTAGDLCRTAGDCGDGMTCRQVAGGSDVLQFLSALNILPGDGEAAAAACGGKDKLVSTVVGALERGLLGKTLAGDANGVQVCTPTDTTWQAFTKSYEHFPGVTTQDMAVLDGDRMAACQSQHVNCSVVMVGDGVCQESCNNKECMLDGGDCRNLPTLSCPSSPNLPSVECSGRGQCFAGRCFCYYGCDGNNALTDCSNCPTYEDDDMYYDDDFFAGDDDGAPGFPARSTTVTMATFFSKGPPLKSWDGSVGTAPTSVLDADRKSGHVFTTPPTVMSPSQAPSGQHPTGYFSHDGAFGAAAGHPRLGLGFHMARLPDVAAELLGTVVPAGMQCRAQASGSSAMTATDLMTFFGVTTPRPWMFQLSKVPSALSWHNLGCGWLFTCPDTGGWHSVLRYAFPSTCDLEQEGAGTTCHASYDNFAELLGLPDASVLLSWVAPSYPTALPDVGVALGASVASVLGAPTPCSTDADCEAGVCVDLAGPNVFDLPSSPDWDPLAWVAWGKVRNSNPKCCNPTAFKATARHLLLDLGNFVQDKHSSLQFCMVDPKAVSHAAAAWSKSAVDTACQDQDSCYAHPATVKGLKASEVNVAPAAGILSAMVPDGLPGGLHLAAGGGTSRSTFTVTLPGSTFVEAQKPLVKEALAGALSSVGGVTSTRMYFSTVHTSSSGTTVTVVVDMPPSSGSAVEDAVSSPAFNKALGSSLAAAGATSTAASTPSASPGSNSGGPGSNGGHTAAIIGGVVAGVVLVAVLVGVVWYKRRQGAGKDGNAAPPNEYQSFGEAA